MSRNVSASQIKKFRKCPKQYWFRYISEQEPIETDTTNRDFGSAVHEAIEVALLDDIDSLYEAFADAFDARFDKRGDWWDRGIEQLGIAERVIGGIDEEILGVEERVEFEMDSFGGIGATAIMDVITERRIIDWKTGNRRKPEEAIQGALYALAYRARYGEYPERVEFVYLKHEEKGVISKDPKAMKMLLDWLSSLLDAKESGEFPATPGDICYWCGYEPFCGDSEAGWPRHSFDAMNRRWPA